MSLNLYHIHIKYCVLDPEPMVNADTWNNTILKKYYPQKLFSALENVGCSIKNYLEGLGSQLRESKHSPSVLSYSLQLMIMNIKQKVNTRKLKR